LAGANQIYGAGMIESGVTFDLGQLVMDNEIARMIKFAVGGIAVTDESMAIDDIARVGAFGDFLSLDATLKHMRELSQPTVLDRRVREDWESRGASDLASRSRALALELVESHQPAPVDPDVAEQVERIIAAADREKGVA
jgi:trimethylamine---corrinoid protein Co-methyltransferase